MPCVLHERLFAEWQATFASRIGRPQMDSAQRADYKAFCRIFDSDQDFEDAAQYVYERWKAWDAWPAPIEFESARANLRRKPDAEIAYTYEHYIAPARQIAPPKSEALLAFGALWRLTIADCAPAALAAERIKAAKVDGTDPWLTDERRGEPGTGDRRDAVSRARDADADREVA